MTETKQKGTGLTPRPPIVVVVGHIDHGKCVHPDTLIPLADGQLLSAEELWHRYASRGVRIETRNPNEEIREVADGPCLISIDQYVPRPIRTTHFWKIPYQGLLIEVELASGDRIRVTPEHPFLVCTTEGTFTFRTAKAIGKGDFVIVPQVLPFSDLPLVEMKEHILTRLAAAGGFVAFLDRIRSRRLLEKLANANLQALWRAGVFSTEPIGVRRHLRFRVEDLLRLAKAFGFSRGETFDMIASIKNSSRGWRAGHTSLTISLPRNEHDFRKLGYVLGILTGDGHLNETDVILHNNAPEIQKAFQSYLRQIFGLTSKLRASRTVWQVHAGGKTLSRFLNAAYELPIGEKSSRVRVPLAVQQSRLMCREYIAGLFDTDGFMSPINHSLELTSKSGKLIADVATLLLAEGVHSVRQPKGEFWTLRVANRPYLTRFKAAYHLQERAKRRRLHAALRFAETSRIFDLTPLSGAVLTGIRVPEERFPYFSVYKNYPVLSRYFLQKFLKTDAEKFYRCFPSLELKALLNPGEISAVRVRRKRTYRYRGPVYDFSLPTKNFVAERVIVHNTTLLDAIRKTQVAEKEAGGITQAIGAYQVTVRPAGEPSSRAERGISPSGEGILRPAAGRTQDDRAAGGRKITFIDTPGHEAFSAMRQRGTKVADVAVLVVAADEGVKPQTEEAIRIIRDAELPFVVAISKMDKPNADPARVRKQLADSSVLVEGFGGTVPAVELSATTGAGVEALLETILLLAELEGLAADPAKPGEGVVIESHLDPKRGATATLLVEDGTLHRGEWVAIGEQVAPVRIFENFLGKTLGAAGAGEPIRIVGFPRPPELGERFVAAKTRAEAETLVAAAAGAPGPRARAANGATPTAKTTVTIVLKADVLGSQEALASALAAIASPELSNRIVKSEVGDISESDVKLAAATKNTFIVGFRVKVPAAIRELADRSGVTIVVGEVIYDLLEAVKSAMLALAPAEVRRVDLGTAKILALFKGAGQKQVVGGRVERGLIRAGARFDIVRNNLAVGAGRIVELQSNRRPASEVPENQEFGILADADTSIAAGDTLAVFTEEKVPPSL